jgi:hypothetical protein
MLNKQAAFEAARDYLMRHPEELVRWLRNALTLTMGVPLDALRWIAEQPIGKNAPRDVQIEAVPPGVRVGATLGLMGTTVRASAVLTFEDIRLNSKQLRFDIKLSDVALKLLGESDSPVATLLKSGALDLSKPGNLVAFMPKRPAFIVDAFDDRIVLDLMKHPVFAKQRVERLVGLVTPFVTVGRIRAEWEHLDVVFRPFQGGIGQAWNALRSGITHRDE